ncbi:class I SAM-dependent methyltransferase [Sphingopyxis sp. PET50]|uniref:class I SAM-dependent methyltransferase n=1 Tax=Sphingopyxis sp. PET50 TaxID=2976533 RepID=UPI0021B05CC2|nr:methyltransferase [Sphingopyxis sp. PET50]
MSHLTQLRNTSFLFAAFGLAVAGLAAAMPVQPAQAQVAAVAPGRPAADKAQDADRKPGMMVKFARIKRGDTVVEILPGEGYFTRIFSNAVGPKGKVYATELRDPAGAQAIAAEPGRGNVEAYAGKPGDIAPAGVADVVWTSRNYHDLKGPKAPADAAEQVNKAAFAALKPGGYYIVLDHSAAAGSGLRDVDTLHRIDVEAVKAEVLAAGFVLEGESPLLVNKADARTLPVFDDAIKGKTDQFVLRFRKPG